MSAANDKTAGVPYAILSAFFLGLTPIFGKQTINAGLPPLAVVAGRTAGAAALLFLVILIVQRRYLYIYPLGLVGCLIAGGVNGLGSLLYYSALARIDAGLGQLLYALYPVFVALLLHLDGQRHTHLTVIRLALSLPALYFLTQAGGRGEIDLLGVGQMLGAGALYALHIPINERVLYEVPAPTVTLYTLLAMAGIVIPAYWILSPHLGRVPAQAFGPWIGLTLVTFSSRLTLFAGVKSIGGLQTSLLGLSELLIAVLLAHIWLGEQLSRSQWIGAAILILTLVLVGRDEGRRGEQTGRGWLYWLRPPLASTLSTGGEGTDSGRD